MQPNAKTLIGIVVTVVWALTYLVALFVPTFHPGPETSTVMLVVVTWLFALEQRTKK